MSDDSERFRRVAGAFTDRVRAVPEGAWENPAPCEGWVARDVVRHLVGWMPGLFLETPGLPVPQIPDVDDDPLGAWLAVRDALQAALDDPEVAGREYDMPAGRVTVGESISRFGTGDVLVHTWDLARATGQDETLDPDEVHRLLDGMVAMEGPMRASGHYGPRVEVPADAPEQDRLIAFSGRVP